MPQALTRLPEFLPVLYNRAEALAPNDRLAAARQQPALEQRAEEFHAEPPRSELRFKKGGGGGQGPADNQASFTAQQIGQNPPTAGLLAGRRPALSGYAAYTTAAQHGDPSQPRNGQTLDVSI